MATSIGGIKVDLQLSSAAFLNDIAKSNAAISNFSKQSASSLTGLQKTIGNVNAAFLGFLTVRELRKVVNFTEECLKLASTIKGPLGTAAKDFQDTATRFENSFKLGVAQGFMDAVTAGLQNANVSFVDLAKAGIILGNVLGRIFTSIVNFLTHDIPEGVKTSIDAINAVVTAYNSLAAAREKAAMQPSALAPGAPGSALIGAPGASAIPTIDTSQIKSWVTGYTDLGNAAAVAGASLQTTAEGQRQLNFAAQEFATLVAANNALFEATRTPLENYALALDKITTAHASVELATRATAQAQFALADSYLQATAQATGLLAGAFKENKAIQIANAIVNTAAGVVKALGDPKLPFPLDFAVAAATAAAGAAQIATILSTEPGSNASIKSPKSGKSKSSGGVSSSAPAAAGIASSTAAPSPQTAVNITLVGESGFSREQVRALIDQLNQAVGDGAV